MKTNTLNTTGARTLDSVSMIQKIAFVLIWLAVSVPLIWGVLKTWDDVQNIL